MTDVELRHQVPDHGPPTVVDEEPLPRRRPITPRRLALLAGLLYVPFVGLGYGTDVDITNVLRSGRSLLDGEYRYSRPPGALPYEALVGVLDRVGPVAINLASAAMAVGLLLALAQLVAEELGDRAARIAVVVVATQPWFWVAATSLGDYVFALGFLLLGVLAARHDRRVLAGFAFATAIAFRSSSALLVAAYVLAELFAMRERTPGLRTRWRDVITTGVVTAVVGLAWFVPSWLSVGRTTRFLRNEFETTGLLALIGRWGVKNIAFLGVFSIVVLLALTPVLVAGLRRLPHSLLVRFTVLVAIAAELLFLRFPWKPVHLLPVLLCIAVLLAASPRTTNRHVAAVVVSQVLLAFVSITVAEPDIADAATTGRLHLGVEAGVVLNDLDCRIDPPFGEGGWPDLDTPAADYAAIDVFTCQARSWRPGGIPEDYGQGASEGRTLPTPEP
ncbi:MAG TPA: hypothetical protein VFU14_01060 [Acidimicrobiales bacterium]|nr:hypothetical protein [Acidimicrobiales bacterium]